jgi:hypothetical protein
MAGEPIQPHGQNLPAFILSLIAGLWMLGTGGMMGGFGMGGMMRGPAGSGYSQYHMYGWRGMNGWMWGRGMHAFGLWWPSFGVAAGILVIAGAIILYTNPRQQRGWGVVILTVSALDFFLGMGGLVAGALGVIGGILAISG